MRARNEWILASSIAIGLFLFYVSAPLYYGSDADYAVPQIVSILQDGNQNLDEYSHLLGKQYQLQRINGHIYDYFPFGTVYLALVPASILTLIYDSNYISLHRFEFSIVLASILMAIACAFIYHIGRLNALNRSGATMLALYAGLGTSILSTGTRALWQQTGCLFVAVLCLWLFEKWKASRQSAWLILLGALLGFGFLVRPTMLLFALCFGLYFLISERRIGWRILYLALPGLVILAIFVIQSLALFQSWLPPYYLAKMPASDEPLSGLMALFFSPSRGLFFWHPIFLVSSAALLFLAWNQREGIYPYLALFVALQIAVLSRFMIYWGGHSLGPRLLAEIIPVMLYASIPVIRRISFTATPIRASAIVFALALGFMMHTRAVFVPAVAYWNLGPPDINDAPERVWYDSPAVLEGDRNIRALLKLSPSPTEDHGTQESK